MLRNVPVAATDGRFANINMNSQTVTIKVLGKDVSTGFFGGKTYTVVVQNETLNHGNAVAVEVPIEQYFQLNEGKSYNITMYSSDGQTWYFRKP